MECQEIGVGIIGARLAGVGAFHYGRTQVMQTAQMLAADIDAQAACGNKALEAAKIMKLHDPTIKTILCGSSNDRMSTYPEWNRTALEIAWEQMDYLSMHYYAGNKAGTAHSRHPAATRCPVTGAPDLVQSG
jgi:alpha-L-arabinofuranosidase